MRSCCENEQHSLDGIEKYAFIHRIEKQFDLHRNACILFNDNNLYANQCWYHMEDTRCLCIQLISSEWATVRINIYTLMHNAHTRYILKYQNGYHLNLRVVAHCFFGLHMYISSICSICVCACVSVYFAADFAHDRKKAVNFGWNDEQNIRIKATQRKELH